MHIAFYSSALPDSGAPNGIVTYVRIMRDALRSLGHRVTVVTSTSIESSDGIVSELPKLPPLQRLFTWPELRALTAARDDGAEVFEMEESFGAAGKLVGRGVPIVVRLHGPYGLLREFCETPNQQRLGARRQAAEFAAVKAADAVFSPTETLLDALVERFQVKPKFAKCIPNPTPLNSAVWNVEKADLDQILFVGRMDRLKGADIAVEAFRRARETRPSLKLIMVGPGDAVPGITCLGTQTPKQIHDLRLQSGLALTTSRFENFPYSIAEAMSLGMPVLASATFGARSMITDRVDGRLVPIGDIDATANALLALTDDPEHLAACGKAARARVAALLSPEKIASLAVETYRNILKM